MRNSVVVVLLAIVIVAALGVCMSFCSVDNGLKGEKLSFYEYHVGNGYSGRSYEYSIYLKDTTVVASIKECNYLMMDANDTIPCKEHVVSGVPREMLDTIGKLLVDANVHRWESHYTNPDVMDGDSWSITVAFGDEKYWSGGYMAWPKGDPTRTINEMICRVCGQRQNE